jgi:Uma2 family endonuclease
VPTTAWVPSTAVVIEIVSADDETYDKLGFYAAHGVEELIVADPAARTVICWRLDGAAFRQSDGSATLAISAAELEAGLTWP